MKGLKMKKLNKFKIVNIIFISVVALLVLLKQETPVYADSSGTITVTVTSKSGTIHTGENVEVTVSFQNSKPIGYAHYNIMYDSTKLSYVSGDISADNSNGTIPVIWATGTDVKSEIVYKLVFKAIQTGTATISITPFENELKDTDMGNIKVSTGSTNISIIAPGSDDATLSSIQVGGANLSPAFAKWTLDYKCYVDNSVTSVNIAAASSQGGRVEIAGNTDNLAVGNNYVTITSYAPNGKAMKYNLNIFRLEPPTDPPTEAPTDPPTEPPASFKVTIDGKEYNVSSEFDAGKVPDGFEVELGSYNGKDVITATGSATGFTLMYLVDSEGNGNFYVYDGKNFYPYIVISNSENTYYVFDSRKADTSMAGEEKDVKIKDTAIKGYVDGEYIYFYAMNSNKKYSWYSYDTVEGTIQRLRTTSPEIIEDETTTPEETASTPVTGKNDDGVSFNNKNIIIIGGALLLIVIAGAVIFLISKKEKKYNGYNEEFAATDEETQEEATAELEEVSKETEEK